MVNLCPEDPARRFHTEQWMEWSVSELGPAMNPVFWGLVRTLPEEQNQQSIQDGLDACTRLFGILDEHLQKTGFVSGNSFTMGDIPSGAMAYRWYNMEIERPRLDALQAWYEKLQNRPSFRKHVMLPLT